MKKCEHCLENPVNSERRKFCSRRCAQLSRWSRGLFDGNWTEDRKAKTRARQTGEKNPAWKGGRYIEGGYVYVRCPAEFSLMAMQNGYVLEHRLVMARHIGRSLVAGEVVHHGAGGSLDNRLSNLELYANQAEHILYGHQGKLRKPKQGPCWCGGKSVAHNLCDRHYKMAERYWKSIGRTMDSFRY